MVRKWRWALVGAALIAASFAQAGSSTKGFSAPSRPSVSSPAPSVSGFRASSPSPSAAPRSGSVFDQSVSRGVAKDAMQPPKSAASIPTPSFTPSAPTYSSSPSAPAPRVVVREYHYHTHYDDGNYSSGVLAGMLLEQISRPRPTGDYDREQYEREMADMRAQLREVRARGDLDPATSKQVETTLAVAEEKPSGGLGFWFWMIVFVTIAATAIPFARIYYVRERQKASGAMNLEPDVEKSVAEPDAYRRGQRMTIDPVPFVLTEANDSDMPDLSGSQSIDMVSTGKIYGDFFDRAYSFAGKDEMFLERFRKNGQIQLRVFSLLDERFPVNAEEWAFFTGSAEQPAFIGLPAIDYEHKGKSRHYDRVWAATSDAPISPVTFHEQHAEGAVDLHKAMLYSRVLKDDLVEYLLLDDVSLSDAASIKVWVGIDIAPMAIQVA